MIFNSMLHRNATVWDRPDDFYPDRWYDKDNIPLNSFKPFGSGLFTPSRVKLFIFDIKSKANMFY